MSRIDPFDSLSLRKNLRGRTLRGGVVTLASQGALFGVQFVGSVLMARLLTPDDFGLVGMVVAVVGFLETFKDLGLSAATVQEPCITKDQVNVLFWFNTLAGASMSLVTLILAPVLVWFYGRSELFSITVALSLGFLISGLAAQQKALLRRSMQFGRISAVDLAAAFLGMGAGLAAAWWGAGYWSIVIQQLAKALISTAGFWVSGNWRPGYFRWDPSVKPMLRFGGFFALNNVMNYASRNVDNIAIGWMWGAGPLGIYSRAYSLLMLPLSQVNTPIAQVAIPALSRIREEGDRFRASFLGLMRAAGLVLVPPVAVLMACADSLVILLLGEKWAEVAVVYRWLGLAALAQPMTTTCGVLFQSQGRSKEMTHATMINSFLAVSAILVAVPWGITAVAASYSATGLFIRTPILLHFAAKVSSVTRRDMYSVIVPQLFWGGLIFLGTYSVVRYSSVTNHLDRILIGAVVGGCLFIVGLILSGNQRSSLRQFFRLFKTQKETGSV